MHCHSSYLHSSFLPTFSLPSIVTSPPSITQKFSTTPLLPTGQAGSSPPAVHGMTWAVTTYRSRWSCSSMLTCGATLLYSTARWQNATGLNLLQTLTKTSMKSTTAGCTPKQRSMKGGKHLRTPSTLHWISPVPSNQSNLEPSE